MSDYSRRNLTSLGVTLSTSMVLALVSWVASPAGLSTLSWLTVLGVSVIAGAIHWLAVRRLSDLDRFCKLADQFPFGVVLYEPDLRIRYANTYALEVYGESLSEVIGKRDTDLLTPDAVQLMNSELDDAMSDGAVRSVETMMESAQRRRMFLMTFAPMGGGEESEHQEILSVWFETSRIGEMTERLSRLNQTLATLINANRALIGGTDEDKLLSGFCEALCHSGPYEVAAIGVPEKTGAIRPLVMAGCDDTDLASLYRHWGPDSDNDSLVHRAMWDGDSSSVSLPEGTEVLPGRRLREYAALPIKADGDIECVLCLYSHTNDAFNRPEMELLRQLADDAGFALESVRVREQLARSRESLETAHRIAHLGTWEYELRSDSFTWSAETYRIHGWPQDAPVNLAKLEALVHPDDREKFRVTIETMLEQSASNELQYRIVLPNNEIRYLHLCGRSVLDKNHHITALTGTVLDNTRHTRKHEEARTFERMLVNFLDNLPAVITLKDQELKHVYGNTAALDTFHADSEHFVGSTDTAFLAKDTATILHAVERSALNTRQPVMTPDIPVGHNGDQRHLRGVCFPVVLPDGDVQVGMYATDVTELQTATAKTGLLESALEAAANGVVITDTAGTIEWVNSAFTKITGYSSEEAIGNTPRILSSGCHPPEFYQDMWSTLLKGEVWNGELKNRRKDGTVYDEQMTITPVRDSAGEIAHYIAIKLDVSDRHELEAKLLRSQRMESIGMLAGGVAHDLNNILAPILMGVEVLRSDAITKDEKEEFLNTIVTSCERGAGIIRQVLTFARGAEGERVIVQIRHQVKDIVKMARETFPKDIQITMDVASDLWTVLGDPTQLHQVLLNFSVNARDAMPLGGKIDIIGENIELTKPRGYQSFEIPPGNYVRIEVRDSGTGMPKEVLEHIFEPFFTTKEQGKGTGLGLPTVLGIVKSHGGLVEFQSTPGKGTGAIAWLPASEVQDNVEPITDSAPPTGHGETILLVDDEPEIRQITQTILEKANYQVMTAEDGAAAVAVFAGHQDEVVLVLTDIMMPVMDGVALTHALQRIDPQVHIVGSTGFAGDGARGDRMEELRQLGVKTVLQKPYTRRQLLNTLAAELKEELGAGI